MQKGPPVPHLKTVLPIVAILIAFMVQFAPARARNVQTAILAGGCFWCVESDFDKVEGVLGTTPGFTGGTTANPTYRQVSRGGTGHFESVRIRFDADVISYRSLIDIFWRTIDPLDAGGQFCDRGDSYRTAVFVLNEKQRKAATASRGAADALISGRIVTPILAAGPFYPAGKRHQDYYLGKRRVITRYGVVRQSVAYKKYRRACGRDLRVRQIWGAEAPFADH